MERDPSKTELDDRTRQALARLADGSLDADERVKLEERLAASPELRIALRRQRAGATALRGLELAAPASLRARIAAEAATPSGPVRRRRLAFGGALAGAMAAIALTLALALPNGSGGPTVVQAARLSELPATRASVPVDPANSKLLAAEEAGVSFPNLHSQFAWRETGSRSDELGGRNTKTVFYERDGERIGYTILSGDPVDSPPGARRSVQNGVQLSTTSAEGKAIVTWLRGGRTCVISGRGVSAKDLREVASWKGDGAVPF